MDPEKRLLVIMEYSVIKLLILLIGTLIWMLCPKRSSLIDWLRSCLLYTSMCIRDRLQAVKPINSLGELTEEEFDAIADTITDPVNRKRAKHAVYENQRTIRAVEALKNNDIALFGKLMNESHVSLRDDYEVTGIELDTLAETAWEQPGVIGSRMTGAGFGGCTVSIVEDDKIDAFIENVGNVYKDKIGYAADFYVVTVGDGAHKM